MDKKHLKVCIAGAGGFGREVLMCLIDAYSNTKFDWKKQVSFMVSDDQFRGGDIYGLPIIPSSEFNASEQFALVAIGDPSQRKRFVQNMDKDSRYLTVIHPTAVVSDWVNLGEGSIITAGTIVTCDITLGKHTQLNLNTTVGHDCVIGDYFTTAPSTNISGLCNIGDQVYFGTSSSIKQAINVCDDVTIGMGAVIIKNISEPGVYVGNPLRKLR